MTLIIGVRFRRPGKIYYFDPSGLVAEKGDHVIVETARGIEYGTVVLPPKEVPNHKIVQPLKKVLRLATAKDEQTSEENAAVEKEAFDVCLEKIKSHHLEMKLISCEYTFDRNKLLFYFTADGRIDFRELVKDLASVFRTRIELRQIGVRDETKLLGGIATCGRPFCCHTYLSDFVPVSIKMAKEQNLSLNPAKISGACGRLMCCLKNEEEAYRYLNKNLPHIGTKVTTADGYTGEVQHVSVLKQKAKIIITKENDEKEVREYPAAEIFFDNRRHKTHEHSTSLPEEKLDESQLRELEALEKDDLTDTDDMAVDTKPSGKDKKKPHNTKQGRKKANDYKPSREKSEKKYYKNNRNIKTNPNRNRKPKSH